MSVLRDRPAAQLAARFPREPVARFGERDEAGAVDLDREEVEVRLRRLPVDACLDRGAIAGAAVRVLHVDGAAVQLEVAFLAAAIRDDAVDDEPRVAQEVACLRGLPHHPEHQLAVDELRLDGRDARPAVLAQRPDQAELLLAQACLAERGELRCCSGEVVPAHQLPVARNTTNAISSGPRNAPAKPAKAVNAGRARRASAHAVARPSATENASAASCSGTSRWSSPASEIAPTAAPPVAATQRPPVMPAGGRAARSCPCGARGCTRR